MPMGTPPSSRGHSSDFKSLSLAENLFWTPVISDFSKLERIQRMSARLPLMEKDMNSLFCRSVFSNPLQQVERKSPVYAILNRSTNPSHA
ncbi:hypothetical protein RRG08_050495 [Elysia crispata]|uniref:Uncharacterized protein n=1 Tax=Elysia crispata TaxID=231223 RepID=A0AAE0Y330_9GAST|nr:hypothetical protein RRG08_050495 [Elysia crispata]